jgi:hypothetical protein
VIVSPCWCSRVKFGVEQVGLKPAEVGLGQDAGDQDEPVAVELLAKLGGNGAGEPRPAAVGEARARCACASRAARRG